MDLHFNISSAFTRWVAGAGLLHEDFVVLDVGVQGGESPRWHLLGDHLVVHGLDAIKEVVDELQARNRDNTRRRYHWIAAGKEDGEATLYFNAADPCSSSLYAQSDDRFGVTATRRDAERRVPMRRIDGMIAEGLIPMPDFIKIDVEGHEQDVLLGARGMRSLLGAEIESNFGISTVYPTGHFATLHGLMLETRLLVFDIAFNRVPRKTYLDALGALSLHPEGEVGAPATLNVLFCRNLIDDEDRPQNYGSPPPEITVEQIIKSLIVYELHGLGDVAVDTARRFQARLGQRLDVDKAVNLLADPLSRAPGHRAAVPMVEAEQFNALAAQLADAQRQAAKAQSDRDDAEARAAMLAAQLDQMRRSRSWRMTAPLRNAKIALTQPFR